MSTLVGSALQVVDKGIKRAAGNVATSPVDAGRRVEERFIMSATSTAQGVTFSGVRGVARQAIDKAGEIVGAETSTFMAVSGDGFIPIRDASGKFLLTRAGGFDKEAEGTLSNGVGKLLGWKLDDEGRRPGDIGNEDQRASGLVGSLDEVNIAGIVGAAKATTEVGLDARFNASQQALKGPGQTFLFSSDDAFNKFLGEGDVFIPNGDNLNIGDSFKITSGLDSETLIFGGVTTSYRIDRKPIFGVTDSSTRFSEGAGIVNGHRLRVDFKGKTYDLKFTTSAPEKSKLEFNSLRSLADAIKQIDGLTARVSNNTLAISTNDGISEVKFFDVDASNIKSSLGISDIEPTENKRFSTMGKLKEYLLGMKKLNIEQDGRGLSITTKLPTDSVTFTSSSKRENKISYVSATQVDTGDIVASQRARHLKIHTPNSGIKAGDFVKLDNLSILDGRVTAGAALAMSNIVRVVSADEDSFTIIANQDIKVGAGPGNSITTDVTSGSWRKVTATESTEHTIANPNLTIANGANILTINLGEDITGTSLEGLADGDSVYISGFGRPSNNSGAFYLPDGYYQVSAFAAGPPSTFGIELPENATTADYDAGVLAGKGMTISRIGKTASNFEVETSSSFVESPSGDVDLVRIQIPNNKLSVGDYIAIGGAVIADFDGIVADEDPKRYKIINSGDNWLEIEVGEVNRDALIAVEGLPFANFIDFFSQLDDSVGFDKETDGEALAPTFDPIAGSGKNLTNALKSKSEEPITVYDSLGLPHELRLAYIKTGQNQWAVTLYAPENIFGDRDIDNADGILAQTTLNFNTEGKPIAGSLGDFAGDIIINWTNGSAQQNIQFNLAPPEPGPDVTYDSRGIVQLNGDNTFFQINQDGYAPGQLIGVQIEGETGRVIANFDNGTSLAIYEIPLVYVASQNNLNDIGGAYLTTNDSGPAVLRRSGGDGVGTLVGGAIERSNIDQANELVELNSLATLKSFLSSVISLQIESAKELTRKL